MQSSSCPCSQIVSLALKEVLHPCCMLRRVPDLCYWPNHACMVSQRVLEDQGKDLLVNNIESYKMIFKPVSHLVHSIAPVILVLETPCNCPATFVPNLPEAQSPLQKFLFILSLLIPCRLQAQRPAGSVPNECRTTQIQSRLPPSPSSTSLPPRSSSRRSSCASPRSPVLPSRNPSASPRSQLPPRRESPSPCRQNKPGTALQRVPSSPRPQPPAQALGPTGDSLPSPGVAKKRQRGKTQTQSPATKGKQVSLESKAAAR